MPDPSTKQRLRQAQAAAKLLDPSTTHIDYVVARGHARLATQTIVIGGVFVVGFVIALAMGYIIVPGALLAFYIYYSALPPRGVVVADQGVAVLNRSLWTNRPNRLISLLTHEQMAQVKAIAKGSKAEMAFGSERLTFSKGEWARFSTAVQQVAANWAGTTHLAAAGSPDHPGAPGITPPGITPPGIAPPGVAPGFGPPAAPPPEVPPTPTAPPATPPASMPNGDITEF